jgi:hypothetical protein
MCSTLHKTPQARSPFRSPAFPPPPLKNRTICRAGGNKRAPLRGLGVSLCMGVSLAALAAGQLLTVGSPGPSRRSHRARVTSTPSRHGALSQEPPRQPCVASASVSSRRWVACSAPTCWCMRSATVESTVRTRSLVSVRGYGTWFFPIPTVSLGVTSALVDTYGCGDGRIGPTRCAVIDAVLDGR